MRTDVTGRPLGYQYGAVGGEVDSIWRTIRQVRLDHRLTAKEVADMAGVASSTVSRGERGYRTWLDKTRKVAEALGIMIVMVTPQPPVPQHIDESETLDETVPEAA